MNRKSTFTVLTLAALILSFAIAQPAEARSADRSAPATVHSTWSGTAAWLANLLHLTATPPAPSLTHRSDAATTTTTVPKPTSTKTLDNGICIDPWGGICIR